MQISPETLVPEAELRERLLRFRRRLERDDPDWRLAVVQTKVNLYYLTGTRQSGALFIPRDGEALLCVRRSYARALDESRFPRLEPIRSFRDVGEWFGRFRGAVVHLEKNSVPLAQYERLDRYFSFREIRSLDRSLAAVRAVKSPWELERMRRSGAIHREVLETVLPTLLREGLSEAELGTALFAAMLERGHHGVTRIGAFDTELFLGQICFGESAYYPNPFDGPGGVLGLSPAVPLFGSRSRHLRPGQLVFVDVGCGVDGYHTDKTLVYAFGAPPPAAAVAAHARCIEIQNRLAESLRPGVVPAALYEEILAGLDDAFLENFMGTGPEQVRFLGHGVGLTIDEYPVIAKGFDEPLEENMTLALEPKAVIPGVGMAGLENTFVVTAEGGRSLTGPGLSIREV